MRVGTGIILSVLSLSILAAVSPNNDNHGPLLARRAVSPNSRAVLWKRNNEDQEGSDPSSSGAGGGSSSGSSNSNQSPSTSKGFHKSLMNRWATRQQKYILEGDEKLIQRAIKKLTDVTKGEHVKEVIADIESFLRTLLKGAKVLVDLFDNKALTPFSLSIPKGKEYKSLIKEMSRIQRAAKDLAKEYLRHMYGTIDNVNHYVQFLISVLGRGTVSTGNTCNSLVDLGNKDYMALLSKVKSATDEDRAKVNEYAQELQTYHDGSWVSLDSIKDKIKRGVLKFDYDRLSKASSLTSKIRDRIMISG
ncbi:hypothetical protein BASA50_000258 [Batrachochytrium salamandrivorans]|uniref:Uncharacterized protein n=1 Tax=Batrachochytrium salamandrivorans TaxID=1357716 RepID=A0ABQ8EUQ7_9FUNG|nr:hypothetical protein BASA60_001052 [Batrachochytrium salamandrivorans]KAH6586894.1 hypothetical protein BASA50_000258 [Batrachochytrium salamandrivorans]